MQTINWNAYDSTQLDAVPKLDRFFPDCTLGLVEFFAKAEWSLRDLKKIWFGSTFEYQKAVPQPRLAANGIELDVRFTTAGDVRGQGFQKLGELYGIQVVERPFDSFSALLAELHARLRSGKPVLTYIDMSFLQGEQRAKGLFQPHSVAAVGWNASEQTLSIVDQVRGKVAVSFAQYEESFGRYRERNLDFCILDCVRPEARDVPLGRSSLHAQVRAAVANLSSADARFGLRALRALTDDVSAASETVQRPFAIPGLWIFSHDRHALREAVPYWREAEAADDATLRALHEALGQAFGEWFQIDMTIERSLYEQDAARMRKVADGLRAVYRTEERLASILSSIVGVASPAP